MPDLHPLDGRTDLESPRLSQPGKQLVLAKNSQSDGDSTPLVQRPVFPSGDLRGLLVISDGVSVNGSDLLRGINAVVPPSVVVTGGLAIIIAIWWLVSAKKWFKGPRQTIGEIEQEVDLAS